MKEIEVILKQFEKFVKRGLLPSSSFLFFIIVYDVLLNSHRIIDYLNGVKSLTLMIAILLSFVGLSSILSILTQAIFDNRLKGNFDAKYIFTAENIDLKRLRERVIELLPKGEYSDYLIYQEIGKGKNTEHYADQAKEVGIIVISFLFVLVIAIGVLTYREGLWWIITTPILLPIYLLGKELVKSRYRSRAIRIYKNYIKDATS